MHARARRCVTGGLGVCIVMAVGLTGCGGGSEPVEVGAGAEATSPALSTAPPTTVTPPTEPPVSQPPPPTGPSPVDGLTAAELRQVVEAPPSPEPSGRRRSGPVADRVTVGSRTVWRITIPGTYDLLSSRVVVALGGQHVGEGVVAPDLASLVAVATDPAAVVDGAQVTYRWGAGEPIAAGPLEVVR